MDREGFRNRLKQYRKAREENPGLKYYDFMERLAEFKAKEWGDNPDMVLQHMLNDNTYNYRQMYEDNPNFDIQEGHFVDTYKTAYHPTFSEESMYSGKKSPYNPEGIVGGSWDESTKSFYLNDKRQSKRKAQDYLNYADPGYRAIPKYYKGTSEVKEPGLWDKFTNTVSVLYNNAARKIRNFFEEETTGEVIDLSNQRVTRVTPDTKNLTAIYGNEFVENNANNIRTRKQFEETVDTLIGDKNIPLSRISNFYGVEDGKLKSGDLSTFDENTVVIPNRAKKTGKIKEIIFPDNTSSAKLKELAKAEHQNRIKRFAEMADSLGLKYGNNWFTQSIYGSPYTVIRDEYLRRKKSDTTDAFTNEYERINRSSNEVRDLANRTKMKFVTESNDTVFARDINVPQKFKQFYADEKGNALFVNNSGNLTKQQQEQINSALKDNPMYPILIDNGRYMHYQTNNPNYHTYTAYDFARDPKNMYVIGTLGLAEGGEVEPDPLEVLERSKPRINGIPINDRPLSGTDPIGEAMMWGLGGGAASAALRSMFPTYGATAGWLAFGDNNKDNMLVIPNNPTKNTTPIETGLLNKEVRQYYADDVLPRDILTSEADKLKFLNTDKNFEYDLYPQTYFSNGVAGHYDRLNDKIRLNGGYTSNTDLLDNVMAHEVNHRYNREFPLDKEHNRILNRAYTVEPDLDTPAARAARKPSEKRATNVNIRHKLQTDLRNTLGRKPTKAEMDEFIDSLSDLELLDRLGSASSYGSAYLMSIEERSDLVNQPADQYKKARATGLRKALKRIAMNENKNDNNQNYA